MDINETRNPAVNYHIINDGGDKQPETVYVPTSSPSGEVTSQELLRRYRVEIDFKSRGCVIQVGCKQFAYSSSKKAMKALAKYVKNPATYHEQWDK